MCSDARSTGKLQISGLTCTQTRTTPVQLYIHTPNYHETMISPAFRLIQIYKLHHILSYKKDKHVCKHCKQLHI
jgi:hypothetical protein